MMNWEQRMGLLARTAKTYLLKDGGFVWAIPFTNEMSDEFETRNKYSDSQEMDMFPEQETWYYWLHPDGSRHTLYDGDYLVMDEARNVSVYHGLPRGCMLITENKSCVRFYVLYASDTHNEWKEFETTMDVYDFIRTIGKGRVRLVVSDCK
jgi:hypothetical protein